MTNFSCIWEWSFLTHVGKVNDKWGIKSAWSSYSAEALGQIDLTVFFKVWCWGLWSVAYIGQVKRSLLWAAGSEWGEIQLFFLRKKSRWSGRGEMCQLGGSQEETAHLGIEVTEITGSLGLDVFWRAQNGVHIYADFVNAYVFTLYFIQHPSQKVQLL